MFAADVAVKHLVNLVVDDVVWIWHYDWQGTIQLKPQAPRSPTIHGAVIRVTTTVIRYISITSVEIMRIAGHYALRQRGIYHRDVSPGNMILMGVLNDYDLSSLATGQGPGGNERMGMVPSMALNFSQEMIYEVESNFCVVISRRSCGFSSGSLCVARMDNSYH
ncbi:hypothetical protein AZE42_08853 [Rhizopogon vesiculosus]|uniref:Uncharacterized protein n=1 Tax=Rhizopogon vesiculosus TaxID=180088 RepID=A0A1J8Q6V9_9AGAM|nr:hypothetical protein AZE42_08853 [Rhizopogon vesiculosus]